MEMKRLKSKLAVKAPSKNKLMFVLSVAIGSTGVFYSKQYIETEVLQYKKQLEKTEPMMQVVVPKRALVRGEVVTANDLSVRDIPVRYVDSNTVSGSNYEVAIGQRVDFDVDEGKPLLWAHLEGGLNPTFSGKVPAGLRALTVRVDEINSISGFLQPKDKIDLLLSYGKQQDQQILPLLQNVDVIATGVQTLVDKDGRSSNRSFTTITVQVTPDQAKKITLSQQIGKITAMLRNPEDESPLSDHSMTVAELLNLPKPVPVAPKAPVKKRPKPKTQLVAKPSIEYIIGGS